MNEQRLQKAFPVSWDQFHRDARALAWRLREAGPFTAMVTITRGGLVPAAIVARELDLRIIETISIASYDAEGKEEAASSRGEVKLLKPIAADLMANGGAGVLVIDDLVDTGTTARVVRELLPKAHVATVYAKPLGRPFVQTYITEVSQDTWIYFPWDLGLSFQTPIAHAPLGA